LCGRVIEVPGRHAYAVHGTAGGGAGDVLGRLPPGVRLGEAAEDGHGELVEAGGRPFDDVDGEADEAVVAVVEPEAEETGERVALEGGEGDGVLVEVLDADLDVAAGGELERERGVALEPGRDAGFG